MKKSGFHNEFKQHEPDITGIYTEPRFAIGQRALLIRTKAGNILWDCLSLLDEETVAAVSKLGGIKAIAISHPHYYSAQVEWAERFNVPVYLHEDDQQWVMRPERRINFWQGERLQLADDVTLIRLGGHFPGGTVMHWASGANGQGILMSGDIIQVVADHQWVSFMYSYPNLIPLPAHEVARMRDIIAHYQFERLYGAFLPYIVQANAHESVIRSADRYISALNGTFIQQNNKGQK
jgi:glyoxylase-like metal-dependent hydrolase (beta-lactamase superfamily II)